MQKEHISNRNSLKNQKSKKREEKLTTKDGEKDQRL
jgi:hypothetical protein